MDSWLQCASLGAVFIERFIQTRDPHSTCYMSLQNGFFKLKISLMSKVTGDPYSLPKLLSFSANVTKHANTE